MPDAYGGNEVGRAWAGQDVAGVSIWSYIGVRWSQRSNVESGPER